MSGPQRRHPGTPDRPPAPVGWTRPLLALVVLDLLLTLEHVWPTPMVRPGTAVSVELAALLCLLALQGRRAPLAGGVMRAAALVLTALVLARYASVTAEGLHGRPVNLFWDARHLPGVAAMLARAAAPWQVAAAAGALLAAIGLLYLLVRGAVGGLAAAMEHPPVRRALGLLGAGLVSLYLAGLAAGHPTVSSVFAEPASAPIVHQARLAALALRGRDRDAGPAGAAPWASGLSRLGGADVLVVFVESYGAVTLDSPRLHAALAASRADLAAAVAGSGRRAVSALLTSPTHAGGSWLAHASLLAGVTVREHGAYARLLAGARETLVHRFAGAGYRTVAVMPGLRNPWPEGVFYGFDRIYRAPDLAYRGPAFGWWRIPDQYTLARLDASERPGTPGRPLFAFFPAISSHIPFRPVPPLAADPERIRGPRPYAPAALAASLARRADWRDLGAAYSESIGYVLATLADYLRRKPAADLVLVALGDHQPAAIVSGPRAPWEVPVHVIAAREGLLEALTGAGFTPGLEPRRPVLGGIHDLHRLLLEAFGEPIPITAPRSSRATAAP